MSRLEVDSGNIKEFYEKRYIEDYMETHEGIEYYRVSSVIQQIPKDVSTALDYGCGQGGWVELLSKTFANSTINGVDISHKAIQKAKKRFPVYGFYSFDGCTAPFKDNSFDFIFSYHVLEHVSDIDETVNDISRLLKNNGYLLIVFPCGNEGSFEEKVVRLIINGKEKSKEGDIRFFYEDAGHIRRMRSAEIIQRFQKYNINIVEEFYSNQFWGEVDWISRSGVNFVLEFFRNKEGVSLSAKFYLWFLKVIFLFLAYLRSLIYLNLFQNIISNKNLIKKILLVSLIPIKIIMSPLNKMIDLFSLWEWNLCKKSKNGSAQFLIFHKESKDYRIEE